VKLDFSASAGDNTTMRLTGSQEPYESKAAIVPYFANGKIASFRIYRIKRGSFYEKLGFKNGDALVTINGLKFTSPQKALESYKKLFRAKKWRITFLRKGQRKEIDIMSSPNMSCPNRATKRRSFKRKVTLKQTRIFPKPSSHQKSKTKR